jgi:hypothetical protein
LISYLFGRQVSFVFIKEKEGKTLNFLDFGDKVLKTEAAVVLKSFKTIHTGSIQLRAFF